MHKCIIKQLDDELMNRLKYLNIFFYRFRKLFGLNISF